MLRRLGWRRWLALAGILACFVRLAHADIFTPAGGLISCHQTALAARIAEGNPGAMLVLVVLLVLFL